MLVFSWGISYYYFFINLTKNSVICDDKVKEDLGIQIASLLVHYCIYGPNDDNY